MSVTRTVTIVLFAVAVGGLVAVELAARRPVSRRPVSRRVVGRSPVSRRVVGRGPVSRSRDARIPTLGAVLGRLTRYRLGLVPIGRIGLIGFWWWLGYHFFAR